MADRKSLMQRHALYMRTQAACTTAAGGTRPRPGKIISLAFLHIHGEMWLQTDCG